MKFIKYLIIFLFASMVACRSNSSIVKTVETNSTQLNKNSPEDKSFIDEIAPYKNAIEGEMGKVLIVSESAAPKGQPEGELGNLVADILLKKAKNYSKKDADICVLNNGGLRSVLPAGNITLGKIFELMPFENEIVVVTLSGKQTSEMFNHLAKAGGLPVSGVKLAISDTNASDILVNGIPFDENKNYRIVTSDYLANGGDKMTFFKNPVSREALNVRVRDAIIEYMKEENANGNKLKPAKDGRVYKK